MRTSLRKITSQLEQIISEELNNQESNLKNLQTQISDAQKTAATDEGNLKADDAAYLNSIAALKKAASSALANAQSANTQQRAMASAQSRLCAAQAVANYTSQIYSDAQVANGELKGAEAASNPQAAAPCLQSALKEVGKANRNSHFR